MSGIKVNVGTIGHVDPIITDVKNSAYERMINCGKTAAEAQKAFIVIGNLGLKASEAAGRLRRAAEASGISISGTEQMTRLKGSDFNGLPFRNFYDVGYLNAIREELSLQEKQFNARMELINKATKKWWKKR